MSEPILEVASQQDIYNMALGHISVSAISDINEDSNAANACNQFWPSAVREALRAAPYDFNTVYVTLAQSATYQIITNWQYAYQYPTNCVKVWNLMAPITGAAIVGNFPGIYPNTAVSSWNGFNLTKYRFKVRYDPINNAKIILCNVAQAIAEYSVPITDVTQFDATFVRVVSLKLAAYVCPLLVNDDQKTIEIAKLSKDAASDAMRQNAEEGDTDHNVEQSAFLDARGGGGPVSPQFWNSPSTSQY